MELQPSGLTLFLLLSAGGEACARNDAPARTPSARERTATAASAEGPCSLEHGRFSSCHSVEPSAADLTINAEVADSAAQLDGALVGSRAHERPAHACRAAPGSATDVASEPPWRKYAEYAAWTDESGCLVRIDVLAERPGPDHCNWGDTRVLISGTPFGARYTSASDARHYVRDPHGSYRVPAFVRGFDGKARLPSGAEDSGFRLGKVALWIDRLQPSAVYLVGPDSVERWPLGDVPVCQ